ncbi:MAG: hypothetical protein WBW84_03980 [Acidobacteriaceae bacterium]
MLTLVWDVDDVLNDLMRQWFFHAWLVEHPGCTATFDRLTCNPPHAVLAVDASEYLNSMDRFRRTERALNMTPNPEVLAWFRAHGHRCRHLALTSRPLETAPDVAHWVMRHFGAWIRCFGVVPTRPGEGVPVYDRSKGDFLAWLKRGDILIDDSTENILQAASLGLRTLQPAQPWNNSSLTIGAALQQLTHLVGEP